ncbi:hypothetical protein K493DRAFT_239296 [Basidiobolus meristosporus CBS 931.73]|uniref:Chloride channel protein n=1 Tax=Basidiobolus meristosporus CBS 931.73 TaxID=1314790 RepID=A0A1Y1XG47_9FUNG|nr:hypothetical protein K493DRAFT_239296 [Basidiobolus meristosporus CBS 931.73]|eukprot:ORX84354.1 hypothetical protein K493DRAFT_239296 [Basidiobolus meristosporus CBS 931.73]
MNDVPQTGWCQRRSSPYDDKNNHALRGKNNGIRVWYDNYTTIDWIHDSVKERVRLRQIRAIKGARGWLINSWDSAKAWILVGIIGVVCGCIAASIAIVEFWLSDIKRGFCSTNFLYTQTFCCWDSGMCPSPSKHCGEWKEWSSLTDIQEQSLDYWFNFTIYMMFAILFAGSSALLVFFNSRPAYPSKSWTNTTPAWSFHAAGSGVPEVKTILSGFVMRGYLGLRTLWVKTVGLTLSVASGLSTGKEGPLVHIACCVGNVCSRIFDKYNKNEGKRREILSASSAAGVAVAFGAPIGGVLFSLEEVSYYFPNKTMIRSFFCAFTAAMTLKLINPFRTGKIVMFQVTYDHEWHLFEIACFFLIGAFGGLFGAVFIKCNIWWAKIRATRLKNYPVQEVLTLVTITSLVSYWNIYTRMGSGELVTNLFRECQDEHQGDLEGLCVNEPEQFGPVVSMLLYTMLIKIVLTIFTFGCRVPCGIFIPSMVVGASFGRIVGLGAQYIQLIHPSLPVFHSCSTTTNCINPGVYAIVGAAAGLGGVTRMTVSLIVIMFELTGSLTYVLPLMISILVAKWTGDALVPGSIYDWLIEANGHPYLDSKTEYIHLGHTSDITEYDLQVIEINEPNTVKELRKKLSIMCNRGYADGGFPVLNGHLLIGYIACNELEHALDKLKSTDMNVHCYLNQTYGFENHLNDLTPYMDQAPLTVTENSPMELVLELFSKLGVRYVCVVSHGQYVGMIHKKRLLAYLKEYEQNH